MLIFHTPSPETLTKYKRNVVDQDTHKYLAFVSKVKAALHQTIDGKFDHLMYNLYTPKVDDNSTNNERDLPKCK